MEFNKYCEFQELAKGDYGSGLYVKCSVANHECTDLGALCPICRHLRNMERFRE